MATALNSSKKKVTQDDLRRIMSEQKRKLLQTVKKIDSPLAKYTAEGQLMCILCDSVVRSETVWNVHINSKHHRENVAQVKKKREAERERERLAELAAAAALKRKAPTLPTQPAKKVKGILKNADAAPPPIPADFFDGLPKNKTLMLEKSLSNGDVAPKKVVSLVQGVPSDEEDEDDNDAGENIVTKGAKEGKNSKSEPAAQDETLPEGFFDDPLLDAKARNVEYKDPIEEEWEKFQREIKATETMSAAIIAEDQEAATAERQIDEIDEQIRNWSRVLDLERKKELVNQQSGDSGKRGSDDDSSDSAEDIEPDFDEYLDWRAKKSFK